MIDDASAIFLRTAGLLKTRRSALHAKPDNRQPVSAWGLAAGLAWHNPFSSIGRIRDIPEAVLAARSLEMVNAWRAEW